MLLLHTPALLSVTRHLPLHSKRAPLLDLVKCLLVLRHVLLTLWPTQQHDLTLYARHPATLVSWLKLQHQLAHVAAAPAGLHYRHVVSKRRVGSPGAILLAAAAVGVLAVFWLEERRWGVGVGPQEGVAVAADDQVQARHRRGCHEV